MNSGLGNSFGADSGEQSDFPTTAPSEAARVIVDGIERDSYRVLIGSDSKMMDLLYRLSPKRAAGIIYNQMKSLLPD